MSVEEFSYGENSPCRYLFVQNQQPKHKYNVWNLCQWRRSSVFEYISPWNCNTNYNIAFSWFHILFWVLHSWLWISKYWLGNNEEYLCRKISNLVLGNQELWIKILADSYKNAGNEKFKVVFFKRNKLQDSLKHFVEFHLWNCRYIKSSSKWLAFSILQYNLNINKLNSKGLVITIP